MNFFSFQGCKGGSGSQNHPVNMALNLIISFAHLP